MYSDCGERKQLYRMAGLENSINQDTLINYENGEGYVAERRQG